MVARSKTPCACASTSCVAARDSWSERSLQRATTVRIDARRAELEVESEIAIPAPNSRGPRASRSLHTFEP